MAILLQFDDLVHNETARKAMESYVGVLQEAFEHHRKLWEDYIKLQEKCKKHYVHLSPETDKLCGGIKKELASQEQLNDHATAQEIDSRPLLELDTWNMSSISFNSGEETSFSSPNKSPLKIITSHSSPRSPVFSRAYQKTGGTSARKLMQSFKAAALVHNKSSDGKSHHSTKKTNAKCNPKLEISTSHHVETTILPDGKKLKQARLVFHSAKCNEKKPNKPASILPKTEENSINNISVEKAILTSKSDTSINEIVEDVIEVSPTQRNITSRVGNRLKLKRKAPTKQVTKCSPKKNNPDSSAVSKTTINNIDFALCPLPKYTSTQVEDDKDDIKVIKSTVDPLKDKVNTSDFASAKMHNESHLIAKSIKTEKENQSKIDKVQSITQNTNNFAFDETFYLPAEQAVNKNNIDINLHNAENKPPVIKILLNKDIRRRKEDVPEQLNMRCKADRAKLDGWDCWECKQYYKNLSLSKEELQKRRNQCSRHRHRYERPNTPEGFWDPEFPETSSFTYRQNQN